MSKQAWNAIVWTKTMIKYLQTNFHRRTNQQLADYLGLKITSVRTKCYELGLKRMDLEYWTDEQILFLKKNYKKIGDKELSEIFNKKWSKKKGWTLKHIEKKRLYLNLKRTKKQLENIQFRNVKNGRFAMCPVKAWQKRGLPKEGEIRMWRETSGRYRPFIKINGRFRHWAPWAWEQKHGPVPKGMNVVFVDDNRYNPEADNLELVTRSELARRNSQKSSAGLSDNYVAFTLSYKNPELRKALKEQPELLDFQRTLLLLKRTIKQKQDGKRN